MRRLLALALLAALTACAGRRLPPGTPPPEYEPPVVTPWTPDTNDAGTADVTAPGAPNGADVPSSAPAESDLSLDAGAR